MGTIQQKDIVMYTKSEIARLQTWLNAYTTELNVIKHAHSLALEKQRLRSLIKDIDDRIEDLKGDLQVVTGGDRY